MKPRAAWLALAALVAAPLVLRPAVDESLRGFDLESQPEELKWERIGRAIPEAARVGDFIKHFSAVPHLAGTPQSRQTAEEILSRLKSFGLDAQIEQFESLLPLPKARVLELTEPKRIALKLSEPPVGGSPGSPLEVPTYNAFSASGDVTAPLVYANYGLPGDYEILRSQGVDVRGKIVIVKYSHSFRGTKPKVAAERGAVGCIIYSDPKDDGFFQGDVYPKGAFRPPDGVQRGSLLDLTMYTGDPLTPGWASEPGARRIPLSEAANVMKIPVLPISYADAQPLLAALDGPVAPEAWRGGLPITYHLGGTIAKAHIRVEMDNSTRPLYDVIARIPGSESPDEWILDANHHDAWVYGASDPLSGAATLLESARAVSELLKQGWKPKRTLLFAFWDGEEFGLTGSTEWMEKHADELEKHLAVYLNSDSSGKGKLTIGGSHTLEAFVQEVTRDVKDPESGGSLRESMEQMNGEFRINPLGSGSDYTPFLQHLGIASLDFRFAANDDGVYHSAYDDYDWYSHFSDTDFTYGRALAQLRLTAAMRLADAPLLPFEFGRFSWTISRYLDEIERLPGQLRKPYMPGLRAEVLTMRKNANDLNTAYLKTYINHSATSAEKLNPVNELLFHTERTMTLDPGLPGRPWFRHRIYAPGVYTGYDAKTLPGIREAAEAGRQQEASEQAEQLTEILKKLNAQIIEARNLLDGM